MFGNSRNTFDQRNQIQEDELDQEREEERARQAAEQQKIAEERQRRLEENRRKLIRAQEEEKKRHGKEWRSCIRRKAGSTKASAIFLDSLKQPGFLKKAAFYIR